MAQSSIEEYRATRTSRDYRVTLLGVTRGIAFLDSEKRITDHGRAHGDNAVPWTRITAMFEALGDKQESNAFKYRIDVITPDGRELPISGSVEMDLSYPLLLHKIFPIAPPKVESPETAKVFIFTMPEELQTSDVAVLRVRFGGSTDHQELIFEGVPIP